MTIVKSNILKAACLSLATLGATSFVITMATTDVVYAKGGNSGGNSDNGNRGESNNSNSSRSSKSNNSNSSRSSKSNNSNSSRSSKASNGNANRTVPKASLHQHPTPETREINLHARLKGLNSLNRNINGLMNSSDPKMDLFREFVMASAGHEQALATFTDAAASFDADGSYQTLLGTMGLSMPTTAKEYNALFDELTALSTAAAPDPANYPEDAAGAADYETDFTAWETSSQDATTALADAEAAAIFAASAEVSEAGESSSEEAMIEAMVAGLNATGAGPVTTEDMDPDMIEWVSARLGVGDADGFIDVYLSDLAGEVVATEEVAVPVE